MGRPHFVFISFKAQSWNLLWFTQTIVDSQIDVLFRTRVEKFIQGLSQNYQPDTSVPVSHLRLRHSSRSLRLFLPSAVLVIHWQLRNAYTAASSTGGLEAIQREQKEALRTFCILVFVLCRITGSLVACFSTWKTITLGLVQVLTPLWVDHLCTDRLTVTAGTTDSQPLLICFF